MSDNTVWIAFWFVILVYLSICTYFEEKTKQMKIEADLKIKIHTAESRDKLSKSMETIVKMTKDSLSE